MKNITKVTLGLIVIGASVAMAEINLNFTSTSATRVYSDDGGTITLDFSVDGSGTVTLDASTSATDANFIADVNSWDGVVGTADLLLAGETFQITMGKIHLVDRDTGLPTGGYESISLQNIAGGIMGSHGGNAGRIDFGTGAQEVFHIEQTGGSVAIALQSINWNANSASIPNSCDWTIISGGGSGNTFYNMPGTNGVLDVSAYGYSIRGGANDLTIREPMDGDYGAALQGMTLWVTVPEPATAGMLGLGAIATLLIRRFRNRA